MNPQNPLVLLNEHKQDKNLRKLVLSLSPSTAVKDDNNVCLTFNRNPAYYDIVAVVSNDLVQSDVNIAIKLVRQRILRFYKDAKQYALLFTTLNERGEAYDQRFA